MRFRRITAFQSTLLMTVIIAALLGFSLVSAQDRTATPEPVARIMPDTPQTVELTANGFVDVVYAGRAGEVISVIARALPQGAPLATTQPPLDTVLEVLTPEGVRLAFNDDHASDVPTLAESDSFIRELRLPTTGDYLIRLNSYSGTQSGDVEITLTSVMPIDRTMIIPTPATPTATETYSGAISPYSEAYFPIQARIGETLTITVRAVDEAFNPQLTLMDISGVGLAQNNDHVAQDATLGRYDAQIANFVILAEQPLQARVTGENGTGGAFTVTVDHGEVIGVGTPGATSVTNPIQGTLAATLIATYDNTVILDGMINPGGDIYRYSIYGNAGDVYTITAHATTNELNPRIAVYQQDTLILVNEDHGSSDPSLNFHDARVGSLILPRSGSYEVQVTGYNRTSGPFQLTVVRTAQGAPVGAGSEQVFTGAVATDGYWQQPIEVHAGDYITVTVRAATPDFDPQLALLSPEGVIAADNDDHGTSAADLGFLDSRIMNFYVPESGTYTIQVTGYQGRGGEFEVTVETRR